jgi:hypothetical protein
MCPGMCQRVIEPNERLSKLITYLNIILIANILIPIIRIITTNYNGIFNDLICILILYGTIQSLQFIFAGLYIMIVIINNFITFFSIGSYIQAVIQGSKLSKNNVIYLSTIIVIFQFYIFAICIVFPAYKEMKAIFRSSNNIQGGLLNNNDLEIRQQRSSPSIAPSNSNNRPANFVPFGGNGQRLD